MGTTNKVKSFRMWLQERWFEHQEECRLWHSPPSADMREYFNKYKYWLKREYKHQMKD